MRSFWHPALLSTESRLHGEKRAQSAHIVSARVQWTSVPNSSDRLALTRASRDFRASCSVPLI